MKPDGSPSPWTRENVVDALRLWAGLYGRPPRAWEWQGPTMPLAAREHPWPGPNDVVRLFGSWNGGVKAAGFKPQVALRAARARREGRAS